MRISEMSSRSPKRIAPDPSKRENFSNQDDDFIDLGDFSDIFGNDDLFTFSDDKETDGGDCFRNDMRDAIDNAIYNIERKSAEEELADLIGLKEVKQIINKIIEYAEVMKNYPKRNRKYPSMHMMFSGNPGTAKTTVARLLGEILFEKEVLRVPTVYEVGRASLIGRYVGHTAPKIIKAFDEASGGILFIDEAYSLTESFDGFGNEAVATIVQEMENRRTDVLVIFAGYKEKMQNFLETNKGLASRIKFHVDFPDYTENELLEILTKTAADYGYDLENGVYELVLPLIKAQMKKDDFGNARTIRNFIELAELNWAHRVMSTPKKDINSDILFTLKAEDFKDVQISNNSASHKAKRTQGKGTEKVIGFRCA
ncbi:MAG: AAA family ATPase [Lachnospiraceae bacterium]|nr:AAA family ATPase [Lachnospiraceae bacterium]